jgi:hypothetical protein
LLISLRKGLAFDDVCRRKFRLFGQDSGFIDVMNPNARARTNEVGVCIFDGKIMNRGELAYGFGRFYDPHTPVFCYDPIAGAEISGRPPGELSLY